MNTIRELIFTYDPWRGGFLLQLGSMTRKYKRSLFGGLMTAFLSEDNRIEAVESFWGDHGGLPLRGFMRLNPIQQAATPSSVKNFVLEAF